MLIGLFISVSVLFLLTGYSFSIHVNSAVWPSFYYISSSFYFSSHFREYYHLCSQVANQETYGTLGAIVKSRTGIRQVGFLTNRHVAVDLDYPNQKMFHPLPPTLGPGVYLGAVERATSFITDDRSNWPDEMKMS